MPTNSPASPDAAYMAEALTLARRGLYTTHPNPRVGAVVVRDGQIVGRGAHLRAGDAHAEVFALAQAGERARGATLYVTLEPCCHHGRTPPCTDAILAAGVARVVIAVADPNPQVRGGGIALLQRQGLQVELGCLAEEATALNIGFIRRMRSGRPWIRLKQAQSLDGCVALASGESQWLTGSAARADVQRERAAASAIVVGVGTVLADNPRLAPRVDFPLCRFPHKVVLDSHLRTPADAALFDTPGEVWIFHRQDADPERRIRLIQRGAHLQGLPMGPKGVGLDLAALWTALATSGYSISPPRFSGKGHSLPLALVPTPSSTQSPAGGCGGQRPSLTISNCNSFLWRDSRVYRNRSSPRASAAKAGPGWGLPHGF